VCAALRNFIEVAKMSDERGGQGALSLLYMAKGESDAALARSGLLYCIVMYFTTEHKDVRA